MRYQNLYAAIFVSLCIFPFVLGAQTLVPSNASRMAEGAVQSMVSKRLQVHWERTGGFAGMRMAATVDADSLSREQARKLRELIEATGFFDLPEEIGDLAKPGEADRFLYILTVQMEGRSHTVRTGESTAPPKLRSLIRWLTEAARRERGDAGDKG
jgi:hypothetical protein